jgi:hypothetical protein
LGERFPTEAVTQREFMLRHHENPPVWHKMEIGGWCAEAKRLPAEDGEGWCAGFD